VHETGQNYSNELVKDSVLKFYRELQEGSLVLISHHIKEYKVRNLFYKAHLSSSKILKSYEIYRDIDNTIRC
jgi:hypothetical protein